ncbi:MAG: PilZ domain-containing protein [Chitinivibrionales bacterium]|nr:PilZ domain-containing protein [Chitinivibrionales bacterium]MBD3356018.1 PilZ domain-containing protein [Chitinivibrionales bacterium]
MRQYIRHPADIPIECVVLGKTAKKRERLKNVSSGGLCFEAGRAFKPGSKVAVRIPHIKPTFVAHGIVVWCNTLPSGAEVGVRFDDKATAFILRMVEQLCHIEHYRNEVLHIEGRAISGEEAAREWIAKHAETFPE